MSQAIKYEDTSIAAERTVSEIVGLIVKYRGERTSIEWRAGVPVGIDFVIRDPKLGPVPVRIEARVQAVHDLLIARRPYSHRMRKTRDEHREELREKAIRIVWRHLKDLIEQQLLAVEIGQYDLTDVFMSGLLLRTPAGTVTMGEYLREHAAEIGGSAGHVRLLTDGSH